MQGSRKVPKSDLVDYCRRHPEIIPFLLEGADQANAIVCVDSGAWIWSANKFVKLVLKEEIEPVTSSTKLPSLSTTTLQSIQKSRRNSEITEVCLEFEGTEHPLNNIYAEVSFILNEETRVPQWAHLHLQPKCYNSHTANTIRRFAKIKNADFWILDIETQSIRFEGDLHKLILTSESETYSLGELEKLCTQESGSSQGRQLWRKQVDSDDGMYWKFVAKTGNTGINKPWVFEGFSDSSAYNSSNYKFGLLYPSVKQDYLETHSYNASTVSVTNTDSLDMQDKLFVLGELLQYERSLFDQGPVCVLEWLSDAEFSLIYASANVAEVLGYAKEEVLSDSFSYKALIHPEDLPILERIIQKSFEEGKEVMHATYRFKEKGGTYKYLSDTTIFKYSKDKAVLTLLGYIIDVTESKAATVALNNEKERLQSIIRCSHGTAWEYRSEEGVWVLGDNWHSLFRQSELAPKLFLTEDWKKLIHTEDLPAYMTVLSKWLANEVPFLEAEFRLEAEDGSWVWILQKGEWIAWDETGAPLKAYGICFNITDQKELRLQLETSRSEYDSLVAAAPGLTYRCLADKEWTAIFLNDYITELSGYPASDFLAGGNRTLGSLVHPDDLERVADVIGAAVESHQAYEVEYRLFHKSGEQKWVFEKGSVRYDSEGNPQYLDGFVVDISEVKKTHQALYDARERLEITAGVADLGGWEQDIINNKIYWTSQTYKLLGAEEHEDPSPEIFFNAVLSDQRQLAESLIYKAIQNQEPYEHECQIRTRDQKIIWVRIAGRPVFKNGTLVRYVGVIQDINKHKLHEIALQQANQNFFNLITQIPVGIYKVNEDTSVVFGSPTFYGLMGVSEEDFFDNPNIVYERIHPDDKEWFAQVNQEAAANKLILEEEMRILVDGQTRWVKAHSVPNLESDGQWYWTGTLIDITEQKEAELQLKQTTELLEETNKVAQVGGWSFDLKTNSIYWTSITKQIHEVSPDYIPNLEEGIGFYKTEESRAQIRSAVEHVIKEGGSYELKLPVITAKGKEIWVKTKGLAEQVNGETVRLYGAFQDISEEVKQEQKIAEAHQQLNLFFSQSLMGFFIMETAKPLSTPFDDYSREELTDVLHSLKFTRVNKSFCDQYGYDLATVMSMSAYDFYMHDLDKGINVLLALGRNGSIQSEFLEVDALDREMIVQADMHILSDGNDRMIGLFGVQQDVTQQRQARKALAERRQYLQQVIDSVPNFIFIKDEEGRYILANQAVAKFLGHPLDGIHGKKDSDFSLPAYLDEIYKEQSKAVLESKTTLFIPEEKGMDTQGNEKWFQVSKIPFPKVDAQGLDVLVVATDITKRKQIEQELVETKVLLQSVLNSMSDIIWSFIPHSGEVLFVSPAVFKIIGVRAEELSTAPDWWLTTVSQEDRLVAERILQRISEGSKWEEEYRIQTMDGQEKWLMHRGVPILNQEGEIIRIDAIISDISARKKYEIKIRSLLEVTREQNERLKNFAHIVSHNIRSHSANFSALLDLLTSESPELNEDPLISMLIQASDNLKVTIEHLNEVVNINSRVYDKFEQVNLRKCVDDAILNVHMLAAKEGVVITNELPQDFFVSGLRAYLESIALNLVTNGIKYSDPSKKEKRIRIYYEQQDSQKTVCFEDNGLGIDLHLHRDKIFGLFKTFHGNKDARGVGLFISKNQMEAMGGKIMVDSLSGKGSVFKLIFNEDEDT